MYVCTLYYFHCFSKFLNMCLLKIYFFFLLNLPEMRQSVRGHSAAVWLGIANGMQGIHPVMYHL